jgi:Flp pilus assembly protein TadG
MAVSRASHKRSPRRGAAVVEFALIAPLFCGLFLGFIEFGRMVMVQQILVNAARVGARSAILAGVTPAQAETVMSNYLTSAGITGATTSVSPSNAGSGTAVTVTVSVPCSNVAWTGALTWFKGSTLTSTVVMIHE